MRRLVPSRTSGTRALALVLCATLATANAQTVLQIRVVEGDRAVHQSGARAVEPLEAQITDETGKPVEGAVVSFRLPEEGPSGAFPSGMKTEILVSGPDGRAGVHGIRWNRLTGPFQVRVTAVKGELRAGTIIDQYLSDAPVSKRGKNVAHSGGRRKLFLILTVAAAGAAAGFSVGMRGGAQGGSPSGPVTPPTAPPPTIGTPTISVGGPQ